MWIFNSTHCQKAQILVFRIMQTVSKWNHISQIQTPNKPSNWETNIFFYEMLPTHWWRVRNTIFCDETVTKSDQECCSPLFQSKTPSNCSCTWPKMAAELWSIYRHLIWAIRSFYVHSVAYNSQQVIEKTGNPLALLSLPFLSCFHTKHPMNLQHRVADVAIRRVFFGLYMEVMQVYIIVCSLLFKWAVFRQLYEYFR